MKPNFDNDQLFLDLLHSGEISFSEDGWIINHTTGRKIGYHLNGYRAFGIKVNGKTKQMLIHRLKWLKEGGSYTVETPITNHKSGDKDDNSLVNLEAVSYLTNNEHARFTGLNECLGPKLEGTKNPASVLNEEKMALIISLRKSGLSMRKIAKILNVNYKTVFRFLHKVTYRDSSVVECLPHKQEVEGSEPSPGTSHAGADGFSAECATLS